MNRPNTTTSAPSTLARTSGATFLVGVATVGLLTVRATACRIHEALHGYRNVLDYFARTGNWTHQWTTLRNLADLLHQLGDHHTANLLDTAADHAPDAPAVNHTVNHTVDRDPADPAPPWPVQPLPIPTRTQVLEMARQAIERNPHPTMTRSSPSSLEGHDNGGRLNENCSVIAWPVQSPGRVRHRSRDDR